MWIFISLLHWVHISLQTFMLIIIFFYIYLYLLLDLHFSPNLAWIVYFIWYWKDQARRQQRQEGGVAARICTHSFPFSKAHGLCCASRDLHPVESKQFGPKRWWRDRVSFLGPSCWQWNVQQARDWWDCRDWLLEWTLCASSCNRFDRVILSPSCIYIYISNGLNFSNPLENYCMMLALFLP